MKTNRILFLACVMVLAVSCGTNRERKQPEPAMSTNTVESVQDSGTVQPVKIVYHVQGMTCDNCENSIKKGVGELQGITLVEANHEDSTATVLFNPAQTNEKEIIAAIEKRGYMVKKMNNK